MPINFFFPSFIIVAACCCCPPANSLDLASPRLMGMGILASVPADAARMMANRCFAVSLPCSAARTYQTLASSGSRRHPMPISVK